MDIDAVKSEWNETCTTIMKLTPDEATSLVRTVDDLIAEVKRLSKPWPIRGVRVEGDKVIVTVKGGNDAARKLCGEILDTIATDPPAGKSNYRGACANGGAPGNYLD